MAFASIHIPNFLIQAVVRSEPARNRAIALVDGAPPNLNVIAASKAAFQAGIQLGMTKSQASQFSAVEIRHRSQAQEKAAHAALLDLGWSMSPRIEDTAVDTVLIDIAGLDSLFGSVENISSELAGRAFQLGLSANIAITSRIETALIASHGFAGITLIPAGEEAQRIGPIPVNMLPTTGETVEILERWGVRTCAELASLPVLALSERLGQEGVRLHELARGVSERSMVLAQRSLFFEEAMELEDSVEELEPLSFILGRLLDQLCARLNARSLAAQSLRVNFQLEPAFENGIQRLNDSSHTASKKSAAKTYEKSMNLPVPMRDPKMLLKLLRLHLQSDPPAAPILKVSLIAEPARPRAAQGGLFLPSSPDPEKLELTVARLRHLIGDSNVGSPELLDTHRADEFRMACFVPPGAASNTLKNKKPIRSESQPAALPETHETQNKRPPLTAFRVFRPALPASVAMRGDYLARVSFNGLRARVTAISGPWRTSGDWWRENAWHQDEWDLELRFDAAAGRGHPKQRANAKYLKSSQDGVYRIYFDSIRQGWFVRGVYD